MELNILANTAPSNPDSSSLKALTQNMGMSLMDDELMSLGKQENTDFNVLTSKKRSDQRYEYSLVSSAIMELA